MIMRIINVGKKFWIVNRIFFSFFFLRIMLFRMEMMRIFYSYLVVLLEKMGISIIVSIGVFIDKLDFLRIGFLR